MRRKLESKKLKKVLVVNKHFNLLLPDAYYLPLQTLSVHRILLVNTSVWSWHITSANNLHIMIQLQDWVYNSISFPWVCCPKKILMISSRTSPYSALHNILTNIERAIQHLFRSSPVRIHDSLNRGKMPLNFTQPHRKRTIKKMMDPLTTDCIKFMSYDAVNRTNFDNQSCGPCEK